MGTARDLMKHDGDPTTTGRNSKTKARDSNNKAGDLKIKARNAPRTARKRRNQDFSLVSACSSSNATL
jgi:hypothetical protein